MTLRTTGEGGAVAVGVSATREAERASDRDGLSLAMNCAVNVNDNMLPCVNTFAEEWCVSRSLSWQI